MCKEDSESVSHLLLHCKIAKVLWDIAFCSVGVSWVTSDSVKNHLLAWEGFFGRKLKKEKKETALVLLHVNFWCIRREGNTRVL